MTKMHCKSEWDKPPASSPPKKIDSITSYAPGPLSGKGVVLLGSGNLKMLPGKASIMDKP